MKKAIFFIGVTLIAGCQTVSQSQTPSMFSVQQTLKQYVSDRCVVKGDRSKDTKGVYIANLQFAADGSKWVKARASDTMNNVEGLVFYNFDTGNGTCTGKATNPSNIPKSWREMTEYDADVIIGKSSNPSITENSKENKTDTRIALATILAENDPELKKQLSSFKSESKLKASLNNISKLSKDVYQQAGIDAEELLLTRFFLSAAQGCSNIGDDITKLIETSLYLEVDKLSDEVQSKKGISGYTRFMSGLSKADLMGEKLSEEPAVAGLLCELFREQIGLSGSNKSYKDQATTKIAEEMGPLEKDELANCAGTTRAEKAASAMFDPSCMK